jgi:hypothetical protein
MKVLILIIFNTSYLYNEMLLIQKTYIHKYPNIDVYFVSLNEEQIEDIIIKDDFVFIKGKENYINILFKTIEALEYINNKISNNYDFIVRSNISTIINLDNLYKYLTSISNTNIYTGGTIETLRWLLQPYEISEQKQANRNDYYGLKYVQGTGIIMSNDVVQNILKMKQTIEYDMVDDVKLGVIIRDYFQEIYKNIENQVLAKVTYNKFEEDCVFIRNRSYERKLDIHRMRNIVNSNILNNFIQYPNFDKIIYITNKNINDKLQNVKKEWEYLNPDYKVELYDDERCIELLEKYYGKKYCDIFNFIPDGPIKADFFRACIIYVFGGIYVDADIKPLIPLKDYLDDDLDLMTCISYNYNTCALPYNPQLIVAKKYSTELLNIINEYEKIYDNREKKSYSYWGWSICKLFKKINNFDITSSGDNVFIFQNKKYKFIIEEIIDNTTKNTYNFENFSQNRENLLKNPTLNVYCKYKNTIVLKNFANK